MSSDSSRVVRDAEQAPDSGLLDAIRQRHDFARPRHATVLNRDLDYLVGVVEAVHKLLYSSHDLSPDNVVITLEDALRWPKT